MVRMGTRSRAWVFRAVAASVPLLGSFWSGCGPSEPPLLCSPHSEEDPDEWSLASEDEAGTSPSGLEDAITTQLSGRGHGIDSVVVVRHGKLVTEHYWTNDGINAPHDLRSATKSITSLLVGVAIDRGAISGVDEPVMLRLREAYPRLRNPDPWKDSFTIEQLLLMQTGLSCNDWDPRSPGNEENMYLLRDWVHFFLNLPVSPLAAPQSRYCTAAPVTLGRIVKEATQQPTEQFADEALLAPLGIRNYCWATFDQGHQIDTGGHLHLRPRDMAKIGQLVLQRGNWQGQQLVSEAWIDQSTRALALFREDEQYGYLWWLRRAPMNDTGVPYIAAQGNGGQYIFIVPSYDLVVVFTGSNYDSEAGNQPYYILERLILPAFVIHDLP
ncbi:MAG: hypothetical protein RL685_483 [Pseudomonadota bacterium]